jgi:hypothetical protein
MATNTMYLPGFSGVMRRSRATKAAKQLMEQVAELRGSRWGQAKYGGAPKISLSLFRPLGA